MRKVIAVAVAVVLFGALAPQAPQAATQLQACRKAVGKGVARLYQETLKGTQGCYKTRIATSGATTNCLDPSQFDPGAKLVDITSALAATMSTSGTCGPLGAQFAPSCSDAPAACATPCASCGTGAAVAACLACRVVELTKTQVAGLYGDPPDLSADPKARTCQNALGAEAAKYGRTRMKEQQKCQQAVDADKLRAQCVDADRGGKIAKAGAKGLAKMLGKCLPAGIDQIPSLDAAAACLAGGTAASATACALESADTAADSIFTLVSKPASVAGFVMTAGPNGALIPLPGVRIEVVGGSVGRLTDRRGFYELQGIPPGNPYQLIAVDGQRVGNYPRIAMGVAIGMVGETSMGIFAMPEIDMANAVDIGPMTTINPNGSRTLNAPVTLSNPTLPGATLDLTTGTVLTFDVPNRAPLLSISMVPTNVMPFPSGVYSDQIYSFQPESTTIVPPANATFPNNSGLPNGSSIDIYVPDFATNSFFLAGTGTVTTGGTLVESDGPIIGNFDWHFPAPPSGCLTDVIGRVVDASVVPVGGATVLAIGAGATSTANGTFTMPGLPCPTFVQATAAFVPANGPVLVGLSAQTPTVFSGVTDVGDIVLGPPLCGNGTTNPPEQCDDSNNSPRDGCSPTCLYELCGTATVDPGEECDSTPGCTDLCTICGDGLVRIPGEECDDGALNGTPGNPCNAGCFISICGNGVLEDGEECDDGAANGGEFCDEGCRIDINIASGFFFSAVRATLGCGNPGGPTPNDSTENGVPACSPPPLDSTFQFGPDGVGTFTANFASDGSDVVVSGHLEDVRDAGDVPIADAIGWRLRAKVRLTLRGGGNEGTLIDQTLTAAAALGDAGELNAGIPVAAAMGVSFAPYTIHNLEVVDVTMLDPSDGEFATRGHFVANAPALTVDTPAAANHSLLGMVPAYVSCGNLGGNTPNASIDGIPSCAPPETFHQQAGSPGNGWLLGPDALFAFSAKSNNGDILIIGKATDIRDIAGPVNGNGALFLVLRSTVRDPGGDMTMVDFPISFPVQVTAGTIKFKSSLNTYLQGLSFSPLPEAEITLLAGELRDQNGDAFTKLGLSDGH